MEAVIKAVVAFLFMLLLITLLGFLSAYLVMVLANYIFTAAVMAAVFGGPLTFWKSYALVVLASFLFKSTVTTKS